MARYIFSIGLIPVQEFISEARRSRDLRAGSAILSWLTSRVLLELIDNNASLIIPHQDSVAPFRGKKFSEILSTVEYSLPNRATGFVEADHVELVKPTFEKLQENCLNPAWKKVFHEAFDNKNNPFLHMTKMSKQEQEEIQRLFEQPPACPIQLLWVVKAVADGEISQSGLEEIKNRFDDIKRTRPIRPWTNGKDIGKCDQCGKREALSPVDRFHEWRDWQERLSAQSWVRKGIRFERTERLCMICLTKRFAAYLGNNTGSFPSTSEVATREWRSQIRSNGSSAAILKTIEEQMKLLSSNDFADPESLFYQRSFQKLEGELNDMTPFAQKQFRDLKDDVTKLKKAISDNSKLKSEPSNYLAVLMFDGDNMGKTIAKHNELPGALMEFSKSLIEKYHRSNAGKYAEAFYVGGDEGLILTPVETVLDTAKEVRNLFQAAIASKTTLSMGVTIFDRQRPLGGAIRLARQALEKSKAMEIDDQKKNALTITVQTASGNEFSATARWDESWERVANALKLIQGEDSNRKLSMGWAYEVETFLQSLPPKEWGRPDFQIAATQEVKRITLRKLAVRQGSPQEKRACRIETWKNDLRGETWFRSTGVGDFAETTSNQLHLIAFLARESAYQTGYNEEKIEGE